MKEYKDKELMKRLYIEEENSQLEIADELDCGVATVSRWLRKHDIETRPSTREKLHSVVTDNRGYEILTLNNTKVQLHRLLAVAHHGVDSISGMEVHHKNEIPWDNRPENIELLTPSEHSKVTRKANQQ